MMKEFLKNIMVNIIFGVIFFQNYIILPTPNKLIIF